MFSTTSGPKSLAAPPANVSGPLTPKSHESHGNIIRPIQGSLRSRFFPGDDVIVKSRAVATPVAARTFKPWFEDDKENLVGEKGMSFMAMGAGKTPFTPMNAGKEVEKKCWQCYDKATFVLEPCAHTYYPSPGLPLSVDCVRNVCLDALTLSEHVTASFVDRYFLSPALCFPSVHADLLDCE